MSSSEPLAEWALVATYPSNGNVFPQPDRSRAGDARERPRLDPVLQDLHEVSDTVVAENAGADVDATSGVPAYVTSIDAQGHYLRTPITPTQADGILDVAGASTLFAATVHTHDAADITSGLVDLARLGTGTPSAQTFLAGDQTWSLVQHVRLAAKNSGAATLTAGTPVYVTGAVGATIVIEVDASDAGVAATMPAIGIVEEDIAPNAFGHVIPLGVIRQLDTSMYALNETLYVGVGGGLTNVRPTATTAKVQNIARVTRVNASTGEILVLGAGRTNDVPNYADGVLLGREAGAGAGPAQQITVGSGLSLTGATLSVTGGGGSVNAGATEVDFGPFPGQSDATVTVTGQVGIQATSIVHAWIVAQPTLDHTADEHRVETIAVTVGNIVPNVSFDIYATNTSQLAEPATAAGVSTFRSAAATSYGFAGSSVGGIGTRIYGAWTVHWQWS